MPNLVIDIKRTWDSSPTMPVTLTEAKKQCIVDHSIDDTYITDLITECTRAIENRCNISIIPQTVVFIGDMLDDTELPYGPVTSIITVKSRSAEQSSGVPSYEDSTRLWQLEGNYLTLGSWGDCGCSVNIRNSGGWARYQITYRAGMTTVPEDLKLAILNEIAFRYEHRGDEVSGNPISTVSQGTQQLIAPYISYAW